MTDFTPSSIKTAAADALRAAPGDPKALTRLHTLVYLAIGLVLAVVTLVCNSLIENTGGLGDLGIRAVISTAETVITLAAQAFTPLWTVGITVCAIGFARRQLTQTRHLLGGVTRWAVLLRLYLCQSVVYFVAAYASLLLLLPLFLLTPWGSGLYATVDTLIGTTAPTELTAELQQALMAQMTPLYAVWLPLLGVLVLVLHYQFRLALYRVLDQARPGAIRAMADSCRLLRRHRLQLLKLDLSYWWYYLALGLAGCVLWVPDVLTALEVTLPVSSDVAYLVCYLVYAAATAAIYLPHLARVETAYALFYDALLPRRPGEAEAPPLSS